MKKRRTMRLSVEFGFRDIISVDVNLKNNSNMFSGKENVVKSFIKSSLTGIFVLLIGSSIAFAGIDDSKIKAREDAQNKRITQGVESGQLTKKEAGVLNTEQSKIKNDEKNMKSDGTLTEKEKSKISREQHRASNDIQKLKHNKNTPK